MIEDLTREYEGIKVKLERRLEMIWDDLPMADSRVMFSSEAFRTGKAISACTKIISLLDQLKSQKSANNYSKVYLEIKDLYHIILEMWHMPYDDEILAPIQTYVMNSERDMRLKAIYARLYFNLTENSIYGFKVNFN